MGNEIRQGCPECFFNSNLNSPLSKIDGGYRCATNPLHKFIMDKGGMLKEKK